MTSDGTIYLMDDLGKISVFDSNYTDPPRKLIEVGRDQNIL